MRWKSREKVQPAQVAETTPLPLAIITITTTNVKERFAMLLPKLPRKGVRSPPLDLIVP
jgi:hypothetical protein